jgi:hypothetical protein
MPPSPSPTTRVAAGITYAKIPTAARQPERGGEETTEATWPLRSSPTPRLHARPPDVLPHHQGHSCARPLSPTPDTARATPDPRLAALGGGARREEVVPRRPPLLPPCHPHAAAAPPSKAARCSRHHRKIRPLLTGRDMTGSAHPQPEHHRAPVTSLLCSATSAQALCTATSASTARLHR